MESEPGRGTTFAFTVRFAGRPIPRSRSPPSRRGCCATCRSSSLTTTPTNRRIREEWLRRWQTAPDRGRGDGAAAMKMLWRGVALGRPYAPVLLDARMPDMDGLPLAAIIRQCAEPAGSRIVLSTSGDRPGDLARLRELRIDAHLLKPAQQDELLETIYRVLGRTGDEALPRAASRPGPRHGAAAHPRYRGQ